MSPLLEICTEFGSIKVSNQKIQTIFFLFSSAQNASCLSIMAIFFQRGWNSLDPDQARQNVGPDLGPSCLQRLSADNKKNLHLVERVKNLNKNLIIV